MVRNANAYRQLSCPVTEETKADQGPPPVMMIRSLALLLLCAFAVADDVSLKGLLKDKLKGKRLLKNRLKGRTQQSNEYFHTHIPIPHVHIPIPIVDDIVNSVVGVAETAGLVAKGLTPLVATAVSGLEKVGKPFEELGVSVAKLAISSGVLKDIEDAGEVIGKDIVVATKEVGKGIEIAGEWQVPPPSTTTPACVFIPPRCLSKF